MKKIGMIAAAAMACVSMAAFAGNAHNGIEGGGHAGAVFAHGLEGGGHAGGVFANSIPVGRCIHMHAC